MKRKRMSIKSVIHSNLFEYFYSFILFAVVIVFILGGALYYYFSAVLVRDAIKANNNTLEQLKNAQELILSEVDKSFAGMVLDQTLLNYMDYRANNDVVMAKVAQEKIDSLNSINEYIDSIYIYYQASQFVLSANVGPVHENEFYDRKFIQETLKSSIERNYIKTRDIDGANSKQRTTVLTIVKTMPIFYIDKPKAYVVINLKSSYLQKMVDSVKLQPDSGIVIHDTAGNVILEQNSIQTLNTSELLGDFPKEGANSYGYEIIKVRGKKVLISYIYSEQYSLKYNYIIPMATITASVQFLGQITVLFCFLVALFSIVGAFFMSKRMYSPIQGILLLLKDHMKESGSKEAPAYRETTIIENNINRLIIQNKSLERLMEDYNIYQRDKFLYELTVGSFDLESKYMEKISYYGIDLQTEGCFVAYILSIDNYLRYSDQYSEQQKNMMNVYMKETIGSLIFNDYRGFIVETNTNEMVVVINFDASVSRKDAKVISYDLVRKVHGQLTENNKQTFTIGVSLSHSGVDKIPQCYRECLLAVNHRLLLGYNQIILFENVDTGNENITVYPFTIEKEIMNHLKGGEREEVSKTMDKFVRYISAHQVNRLEQARQYFLQLLSSSAKSIFEIDSNPELISSLQRDIYTNLLEEETLQGMAACIGSFYESVLDFSERKRLTKNKELVDSITRYIDSHYATDLSIERLAEQLFLSPSYFRKIFKEETGMNVKEYVDRNRMSKAMELLENPNSKIAEIAEKVGYLSSHSFARAFKTETGKTPGEYRADIANKRIQEK